MRELDRFYIDGKFMSPSSTETRQLFAPSTGKPFAQVPTTAASDIKKAVDAARRAFDDGRWSGLSVAERADYLNRAADVLETRADDIAKLAPLEAGQGEATTRLLVIDAANGIRRAVQTAHDAPWEEKFEGSWDFLVRHEPIGVIGVINPWNGAPWLTVIRAAQAMAAGCTVVDKAAFEVPFSAMIVAEAFHEAGLPPGVFNCVPGDRDAGEALVSHPGINKIAFTGSSAAGRKIAAVCGEQLKGTFLELGGKSAAIVLDDADLDQVTTAVASGTFWQAGQVCVSLTRVLAPRVRYEEVVEALVAEAKRWPAGDPFDPNCALGPLISANQLERVEAMVKRALESGAVVAAGGTRPEDREGYYFNATVLRDVTPDMEVAQEEVFGPVVSVIPYETEDEAVSIANGTKYGLHGAVFTADPNRALQIAGRIETGTFTLNGFAMNFDAPLGGVKDSGFGRMGGIWGLDEYRIVKTINLHPGKKVAQFVPDVLVQ